MNQGGTESLITLKQVESWLIEANRILQEKKAYLTELDQAIGDGDHGINLARGFQEVAKNLSDQSVPGHRRPAEERGDDSAVQGGGRFGPPLRDRLPEDVDRPEG